MEDFTPADRVLVTGANGHVAQHFVQQLLSRPASSRPLLRGTVRSTTSAAGLRQVFGSEIADGRFELVTVPDIIAPGAFDTAVKGCTHIAHIASPLVVGAKDVENDVLLPAIKGTESVLRSAVAVGGDTLKAVAVTSSFAACMDPGAGLRPGYTYGPSDWNPISYAEAADPNLRLELYPERYRVLVTYMASKKLAEKAAWDLYHEAKPAWRLSVVCPTYIGGPMVLPLAKGAGSLSYSGGLIWKTATSKPGDRLTEVDFPCWVDVRDVARAHVQALIRVEAGGKRFILAPIKTTYARIAGLVREKLGWETSTERQDVDIFDIADPDCERFLGMKNWVGFEDMILDTVRQVYEVDGLK